MAKAEWCEEARLVKERGPAAVVSAARERSKPPQHIVHATILHVECAPVVLQPVPVKHGLKTLTTHVHVHCVMHSM